MLWLIVTHRIDPVFFSNCYNQTCIEKVRDIEGICSMKDAVRFASSNNLMGLICSSDLLVNDLGYQPE